MKQAWHESKLAATRLALFALGLTVLLAGTWLLTRDEIAASQAQQRAAVLGQVIPPATLDKPLADTARNIPPTIRSALGSPQPVQTFSAWQGGQLKAVVIETVAPDGYAGQIRLLIGILPDGSLHAVRVAQHQETPGLGDYIEAARSNWINQFAGKTPANAPLKVRKDGGDIDYVSGATITARAVSHAVSRALSTFRDHPEFFLAKEPA